MRAAPFFLPSPREVGRRCPGGADEGHSGSFSLANTYRIAGDKKNKTAMKLWHFTAATCVALMGLAEAPAGIAAALDPDAVNQATFSQKSARSAGRTPLMLRVQVLLDRARFSPGQIDGRRGTNVVQAIAAYETEHGMTADGKLDEEVWRNLTEADGEPVLEDYTIAEDDVRGPFVKQIPHKLEDMAKLDKLAYSSPQELLAEKFHIDEKLLEALNPHADFTKAGTKIIVPRLAQGSRAPKVGKVEVDKKKKAVRAFDKEGKLVAFYPATIGSKEKPAPDGSFKVRAVAENPTYYYDPKDLSFKGVETTEKFKIAPGPNNPVGSVWIDLTAKTYGIHGTPDPGSIGKTSSHGCVRLTNWDARALAKMVSKGTVVEFQ
jgi:lipoprotein-anchoring transpeptidase ErfK/SrfK